ncbi:MAG: hypothetical protein JSS61_01785 [Verrucomicrobia bacterium]|nr:hypothetical protein [Verrucomicrobiota bacterium]
MITPVQRGGESRAAEFQAIRSMPRGFADVQSRIISVRLPSCCSSITTSIGHFFYYRYADLRLTLRAVWSVFCCPSLGAAGRVEALTQFYALLGSYQSTNETLLRAYRELPPAVKNLLFDTTEHNIDRLFKTVGQARSELISTMQRDCHRALLLQKCFFPFLCLRKKAPVRISVIPGAFHIRKRNIPAEVCERAAEIRALKQQWDERYSDLMTAPEIPGELQDHMAQFMEIPVFDASHPQIIKALKNQDLDAISNLAIRHTVDLAAMEGNIRDHGRCYTCRHRHRTDQMFIDVPLQQRILKYLATELGRGLTRAEIEALPLNQQILQLKPLLPEDIEVPEDFFCPVSLDLMSEPMREKQGGRHVFDRQNVINHIRTESERLDSVRCPNRCSNWDESIDSLEFDENLQRRIATWLKENVPLS